MSTQDTTGYIRVTHTGLNQSSIYLKDIDGEVNRGNDRQKSPCYVPLNGSIDILITDRALSSYEQGDIRGFVKLGYVKAYLVRGLRSGSLEEITYDEAKRPVMSVSWTNSTKSSKYEQREWSYDEENLITQETIKQYDRDGFISLQTTTTFTYNNDGQVISSTESIS